MPPLAILCVRYRLEILPLTKNAACGDVIADNQRRCRELSSIQIEDRVLIGRHFPEMREEYTDRSGRVNMPGKVDSDRSFCFDGDPLGGRVSK
jgi:hypothetical protein